MPGTDAAEGPIARVNIGRLTNTIFVFTLFLLFRFIKTPTFEDWVANATAEEFGALQIPEIFSFVNAFLIVAMVWVIAFHVFHQYVKLDRMYLYLHFTLLMCVIFIPITNQHALFFYTNPVATELFHFNMLLIGLVIALEWWHGIRNPDLLEPAVSGSRLLPTHVSVLFFPLTAIAGILMVQTGIPFTQYIYFVPLASLALSSTSLEQYFHKPGRRRS